MTGAAGIEFMGDSLRRLVEKTYIHIHGVRPTPAQVEELVAAEEVARRRDFDFGIASPESVQRSPVEPSVANGAAAERPLRPAQTWLSDDELKEAESVRWFAKSHGVPSVFSAIKWYVLHTPEAVTAPPLRSCVEEFHVVKRCEGVRPTSLYAYRANLATFCRKFGERQPVTVTPKEMSDYLMHWENPATRRHKWQVLSTFFSWLVRMRYALENPVLLGMQSPQVPSPERFILTPAEARDILRRAKHTDTIGYWALSLFAGLRTAEIKAVQQLPNPWSVVRLGPGVIDLPATVTKTMARIVPIRPVLRSWLHLMKSRNVPFLPPNFIAKLHAIRCQAFAQRIRRSPPTVIGPKRVDLRIYNVGRRSYISYCMAMPGVSFAQVSLEVGNNEEIMRKHYLHRVSRRNALKYFELTPDRV